MKNALLNIVCNPGFVLVACLGLFAGLTQYLGGSGLAIGLASLVGICVAAGIIALLNKSQD